MTFQPNILKSIISEKRVKTTSNTQVNPTGKYTYDALYRLISAQGREFSGTNGAPMPGDTSIQPLPDTNTTALRVYNQQYSYDEMGNMLQINHNANGGSWNKYYHYASNNYLLSTSTDNTQPTIDQYSYDAHGNMLQMPHLSSMEWDYADRLQTVNLGGGGTAYYMYNAAGERVRKVIVNGANKEERIYMSGAWEVYRKTVSGTLNTEHRSMHINDSTGRVIMVDELTVDNGTTLTTPTVIYRHQLSNHLGTSTLEIDNNAAIISYEEYYPFGSSSYRSGRNSAETSLKRYRYVGKERDDETGLYYYGARYYAAWLCRFVSVDPLKDDYPYYTPYQYAGNKPITFIDLDGLEEATPPLLQFQKYLQSFATEEKSEKKNYLPINKNDATTVASNDERNRFIQSQANKKNEFEKQKQQANGNFESLFLNNTNNQKDYGSFKPASTRHPGIDPQNYRMATEDPFFQGSAVSLLGAGAIATAEATGAYQTVVNNPYIQRFVLDAVTQQAAKTLGRFAETGTVSFQADDIDLANAVFKSILGGKLGDSNKKFKTIKPLLEEALKTLVDFNAEGGLEELKPINEMLAEFGVRLAFKAIPTNSKDVFDRKELGIGTEFVLEVSKTISRGESKEELMKLNGQGK